MDIVENLADIAADVPKKNINGPKLNIGRTILVGLAFFSVTMFWQVYDTLMPLFLADFSLNTVVVGLIMALDNILALVLLPFMGLLSDNFPLRLRNKMGRRIPFIVTGSTLAAIAFLLMNYAHNARMLGLMMAATAFLLIFMCLYRTPAVALMPDVTPKQIRSSGNAVINIMGTIGGVISLLLMNFFNQTAKVDGKAYLIGNNWVTVGIIAALMVLAAVVMLFKVKENKFVEDKKKEMAAMGLAEEEAPAQKISVKNAFAGLTKPQRRSLIFILLSVALWYMAYNGASTWFSSFATYSLGMEGFTLPLLVGNAAAFIMFIPAMKIGKKIGRKNTVLIGVALMITAFLAGTVIIYTASKSATIIALYPIFFFIGAGWATINVHSFVMSVEMANEQTTGTFTGLYYSFSMVAQCLTPVLASLMFQGHDYRGLMPYGLAFCIASFITMLFVCHGNAGDMPIKIGNFKSKLKKVFLRKNNNDNEGGGGRDSAIIE